MSEIQLWTIPTNWQWATIADIGEVVSGGTPSTNNPSFWGGAINWISPADLSGYNNKFIFKGAKSLTETGLENSSAKLMPAGSIHFSSRAPIGYVVISKANISTSQGFKSIVPAKGIFNEYVYYFLKSAKRIAEERASGTTFKELSGKAFSELPIPIPPVDEQYRIVAKIDELFSELEQGIESIKTCRDHLKVYRQALLKRAFEGKLTEQWRNTHADQLETAEQRLTLIKKEREKHYQKQLEEWGKAVQAWEENGKQDKKPSKPQKSRDIPIPTKKALAELPQLPDKWRWIYSGELFKFVTSGSRGWAKYYSNDGAIFIRITNLDFNSLTIDLSPEKIQYVQPPNNAEGSRTSLQEGDFLFSITGYLGMFAIAPSLGEAYVNQHIALAKPVNSINKKYVGYYIISQSGGLYYLNKLTKGAIKAGLGLDDINSFPIPLCSIEEQEEVVNLLESQLSTTDEINKDIEKNITKAEALRQYILKKAFSGQLVPQAPNDEPANILLERIRGEREATPKPTRKPFTNKKKKEIDTVADLISVLESAHDWLSAQNVFRQCGIGDGAETETIETLYLELRDLVKEKRIEVERRGQEDWLRIFIVKE